MTGRYTKREQFSNKIAWLVLVLSVLGFLALIKANPSEDLLMYVSLASAVLAGIVLENNRRTLRTRRTLYGTAFPGRIGPSVYRLND